MNQSRVPLGSVQRSNDSWSGWLLAALAGVGLMASPLLAFGKTPEESCHDAFALQGAKYFKAAYKAISKCEESKTKGSLPPGVNCRPADGAVTDATTEAALTKAAGKVDSGLTSKCAGADIASLPLGAPCDAAASIPDLVSCITDDAHGELADELIETAFNEPNAAIPLSDKDAQKCQKTLSKEAAKYASALMGARRSCVKQLLKGKVDICPDEKTGAKLEKARDKLVDKLLSKCGDALLSDPEAVEFGFPCDNYEFAAFDRDGNTTNNLLALNTRMARCIFSAAAAAGEESVDTSYPLPDGVPFQYGVAAGDATDSAFIAWTRTDGPASVTLEVATDPDFSNVVHSEPLVPDAGAGDNVVKTDVTGLSAATQYYYRFSQGSDTSRTGRIRTAPSAGGPITFAFTGDSNAVFKPFTVLDSITTADPDLWLYIGDTIYSDSGPVTAIVRSEYQDKYKENRDDRALRDVMARVGTVTIWDDHEVTNDFAGTDPNVQAQMLEGSLAYRDYMPIREDPNDPLRLYRKFRWGDVAEFFLIDPRQYRSLQAYFTEPACLDGGQPALVPGPVCLDEMNDPNRAYLGAEQMQWLKDGLTSSTATFKFIMNGPPLTDLQFLTYDQWPGYGAERQDFLDFVTNNSVKNVIFLTTDFHIAVVNDAVSPDVRELIGGAIAMNRFFEAAAAAAPAVLAIIPTIPSLFPTFSYYDLNRFTVTIATVTANDVTFQYRDASGQLLKELVIPAVP